MHTVGYEIHVNELELDSGRHLLDEADEVVGRDIMSERQFLVYGREALQRVVDGHEPPRSLLYVTLDQDADELGAACQVIKGRHEYIGGTGRE